MKPFSPEISVVMLNYNGLKYLKRTIPAILKLDYPNYEFIIVDNGSTDESIEFIKKFKKIRLIENRENFGYSKGKNIGVKDAKGKYVLLLDNDIIINRSLLIDLVTKLQPLELVSPLIIDEGQKVTKYYGGYFNLLRHLNNKPFKINQLNKTSNQNSSYYNGGCLFLKKGDWIKLRGFDENQPFNIDDSDLGLRAWIAGYKIKINTKLKVIHIGNETRTNLNWWCWKYQYDFSGYSRTIIKTYKLKNLIIAFPSFIIYYTLKTIKQSILKKSIKPLFAFCYSIKLFLKNLPDTLKQRKIIQSKRTIKEDIFLKIKPPKFD